MTAVILPLLIAAIVSEMILKSVYSAHSALIICVFTIVKGLFCMKFSAIDVVEIITFARSFLATGRPYSCRICIPVGALRRC